MERSRKSISDRRRREMITGNNLCISIRQLSALSFSPPSQISMETFFMHIFARNLVLCRYVSGSGWISDAWQWSVSIITNAQQILLANLFLSFFFPFAKLICSCLQLVTIQMFRMCEAYLNIFQSPSPSCFYEK